MSKETDRQEAERRTTPLRSDTKELCRLIAIHDWPHALDNARKLRHDINSLVLTLEICK